MPQIWEVHFTMSDDEISQLSLLFLVFVLQDNFFDDSNDRAESVEVYGIDGVLHERVDKLLSGLFTPSALLLEEVAQVSQH